MIVNNFLKIENGRLAASTIDDKLSANKISLTTGNDNSISISDDGLFINRAPLVVNYDPASPENRIEVEIDQSDLEVLSGSAVITGNVMSVGATPINLTLYDGTTTQLAAAKIPLNLYAKINVDIQNYNNYICGFALVSTGESIQTFIENNVFNGYQPSPYSNGCSFFSAINPSNISPEYRTRTSTYNNSGILNTSSGFELYNGHSFSADQFFQFTYIPMIKHIMFSTCGSYDEQVFIQYVAANYTNGNVEAAQDMLNQAKEDHVNNAVFICPESDVNTTLPNGGDFYYFMMPKYDFSIGANQVLTFSGTETMNLFIEDNIGVTQIIPESIKDGTFLKITSDCELLNKKLLAGDHLILHANKTAGIKIKA